MKYIRTKVAAAALAVAILLGVIGYVYAYRSNTELSARNAAEKIVSECEARNYSALVDRLRLADNEVLRPPTVTEVEESRVCEIARGPVRVSKHIPIHPVVFFGEGRNSMGLKYDAESYRYIGLISVKANSAQEN